MKAKNLRIRKILDLAGSGSSSSLGDEIVILKHMPSGVFDGSPFMLDHHVFIAQKRGRLHGMVNFTGLDIGDCSLSILTAGQLLQFTPEGEGFEGYIVLISPEFFQRMNINLLMSLPPRFVVSLVKAPVRPVVPIHEMYFDTVLEYISLLFSVCSHTENVRRDACAADLLRSFLGEAGFYISRHMSFEPDDVRPSVTSRFLALVQANYRTRRDVGFYARKVSLSVSQLYRRVKEESGKSAKDWIDEYAFSEAKSLLSSTSLSVEEIADVLGFPSQSFFGKYFKRLSGMSPTRYRSTFRW